MASEHRDALEEIMRLCYEARTYTRRTQVIHNVAMKALGLTASQRQARHVATFERIGDSPGKAEFLARSARREQRLREKYGDQAEI